MARIALALAALIIAVAGPAQAQSTGPRTSAPAGTSAENDTSVHAGSDAQGQKREDATRSSRNGEGGPAPNYRSTTGSGAAVSLSRGNQP